MFALQILTATFDDDITVIKWAPSNSSLVMPFMYLIGLHGDSSTDVIMLCLLMTSIKVYTYIATTIMPSIDSVMQILCILT